MATTYKFVLGAFILAAALPWVGCGQADKDGACSGASCAGANTAKAGAGASAKGGADGCNGNGCVTGGISSGGTHSTDCSGADCAGAAGTPTGGTGDGVGGQAGAGPGTAGAPGSGCANAGDCALGEYCDRASGACLPRVCEPQGLACDHGSIVKCNAEGSATTLVRACALTQICSDASCRDIVCVPNSTFCSNQKVWRCSAEGTDSSLVEACSAGQYCSETNGAATCNATKCVPGAALCAENRATQCLPDGSGPAPGGDDCTALTQACYEGECRDLACTPGRRLCNHDDVYLCTQNGTATALFSACSDTSEFCDLNSATCRTRLCTPGSQSCDGTRVVTCDSVGAGLIPGGTDCAKDGQTCVNGSCRPIVCTASQAYCSQGDLYQCNSNGTASTLSQRCGSNTHCAAYGGFAYCTSNLCTPNAPGCSGNVLTTCNSDGSAWLNGGTDCSASGKSCQNGACVAQTCTPYASFCAGKDIKQCAYDGVNSYSVTTCDANSYCALVGVDAHCLRMPCTPGATTCLSEQRGTCATDGMKLSSVSDDCGAQGKVCSAQGCVAQVTDSASSETDISTPSEFLYGDIVQVQSTRTLTRVDSYLSLPASRALTWVVYEKLDDWQYSLVSSSASTGTGTGLQSSGTISQLLQPGKTYFIGVNVTGSYVAYSSRSDGSSSMSFGTLLGSSLASSASSSIYVSPNPALLYSLRLTTTH